MEDFLESEEFYNAMQRYRVMPMARQPDVIEAFEAVKALVREQVKQQAAVTEQMRGVLEDVRGNINPERGFADELELDVAKVVCLQPCPEVLNRVRADAVRQWANYEADTEDMIDIRAFEYAQRIEQGEV